MKRKANTLLQPEKVKKAKLSASKIDPVEENLKTKNFKDLNMTKKIRQVNKIPGNGDCCYLAVLKCMDKCLSLAQSRLSCCCYDDKKRIFFKFCR
jgi:hypothetical protein